MTSAKNFILNFYLRIILYLFDLEYIFLPTRTLRADIIYERSLLKLFLFGGTWFKNRRKEIIWRIRDVNVHDKTKIYSLWIDFWLEFSSRFVSRLIKELWSVTVSLEMFGSSCHTIKLIGKFRCLILET